MQNLSFFSRPNSKSIGPRVAAKLEAGHVSGAISLPESSADFTVKTNVYSGKAIAYVCVHSDKKLYPYFQI